MNTRYVFLWGLFLLAISVLGASCVPASAAGRTATSTPVVPYPIVPTATPTQARPSLTRTATPTPRVTPQRPGVPLNAALTMTGQPSLGNVITLSLTAIHLGDTPTVTMNISLPTGIQYVGGDLTWQGTLQRNQSQQITVTARIMENGYHVIEGWARIKGYAMGDWLHLVVEGTEVWVDKRPPRNNWAALGEQPDPSYRPLLENAHLVQGIFTLAGPVALDRETAFIYRLTPLEDLGDVRVMPAGDARIGVGIPKAGVVITATLETSHTGLRPVPGKKASWYGTLSKGETVVIRGSIRPIATGEGLIKPYLSATAITSQVDAKGNPIHLLVTWEEYIYLKVYTPRMGH